MTPHNNIGFNFKRSENMATKITKKSPVLTTRQSFEAPSPRNLLEYPQELCSLYRLKVVYGLHFCR